MAAIGNWCLVFAHRFEEQISDGVSLQQARQKGALIGEELLAEQQRLNQQQVHAARPLLGPCKSVVTLSYSSTVEAILRHALSPHCRVTVAESRPLMEGRRLFNRLLGSAADLRMITDAQLGLAIPEADLVLVGADSVLRDLAVINKTGTYLAALVAKHHHRDFFVATDTYKINAAADSSNCVLESKSGREIWPRQESRCENVYFDITPCQYITGFLTEQGILDEEDMRRHVQGWQSLAASLTLM
jgi:translation initiation factor eIF-2B subunit delta